jgi:hypothetical protein
MVFFSFFQSTWPQGPPSALKVITTKIKSEVITKAKKHPTTFSFRERERDPFQSGISSWIPIYILIPGSHPLGSPGMNPTYGHLVETLNPTTSHGHYPLGGVWLLAKLLNPTCHHMHQNQKENMHGWTFLNPTVFIGLLVFFYVYDDDFCVQFFSFQCTLH